MSGYPVPSCWGLCCGFISVFQMRCQRVWLLVATYLSSLRNILCPRLTRSNWIWPQSVACIIQGVPEPLLSWKKMPLKSWTLFQGLPCLFHQKKELEKGTNIWEIHWFWISSTLLSYVKETELKMTFWVQVRFCFTSISLSTKGKLLIFHPPPAIQ